MNDNGKTKAQPIQELEDLRRRVAELEKSETERKRLEDLLTESEERYRHLFETASDGIVLLEKREGKITHANPATEKMLGYTSKDSIGNELQDIGVLLGMGDFQTTMENLNKSGILNYNGVPVTTKSGQHINTDIYLVDRARLVQCNIRDITDRKQVEEELRESEKKFRTIFDRASDGMLIADTITKKFLQGNTAICSMLGYTKEEIESLTIYDIHPPKDIPHVLDGFEKLAKGEKVHVENQPVLRKDGSIFYADIGTSPAIIGGVHCLLGIFRDITERKLVEEALRNREAYLRAILDATPFPVALVDIQDNKIDYWSRSALALFGHTAPTATEWYQIAYPDPDYRCEVIERWKPFLEIARESCQTVNTGEYRVTCSNGSVRICELYATFLAERLIITFNDITDRKRAEEALQRINDALEQRVVGRTKELRQANEALRESENRYRELSIVDELTQLYNSRHFYFQLKIEVERSKRYELPLTLLLLDLDNFKVFNDAYGHVEGDQVLRRLGQVVKRCLRETDFAYRYGGEEFTILLPMTTSSDGTVTAERIRTEFRKETFSPAPGRDVHVTVSIGMAQYKPQEDLKTFVHRVDQLMYQGKQNGKDKVCSESWPQEQIKAQSPFLSLI